MPGGLREGTAKKTQENTLLLGAFLVHENDQHN
jgi:hypothetical protein